MWLHEAQGEYLFLCLSLHCDHCCADLQLSFMDLSHTIGHRGSRIKLQQIDCRREAKRRRTAQDEQIVITDDDSEGQGSTSGNDRKSQGIGARLKKARKKKKKPACASSLIKLLMLFWSHGQMSPQMMQQISSGYKILIWTHRTHDKAFIRDETAKPWPNIIKFDLNFKISHLNCKIQRKHR